MYSGVFERKKRTRRSFEMNRHGTADIGTSIVRFIGSESNFRCARALDNSRVGARSKKVRASTDDMDFISRPRKWVTTVAACAHASIIDWTALFLSLSLSLSLDDARSRRSVVVAFDRSVYPLVYARRRKKY